MTEESGGGKRLYTYTLLEPLHFVPCMLNLFLNTNFKNEELFSTDSVLGIRFDVNHFLLESLSHIVSAAFPILFSLYLNVSGFLINSDKRFF